MASSRGGVEEEEEQVERVLLHLGMVLHAIGRVPAHSHAHDHMDDSITST